MHTFFWEHTTSSVAELLCFAKQEYLIFSPQNQKMINLIFMQHCHLCMKEDKNFSSTLFPGVYSCCSDCTEQHTFQWGLFNLSLLILTSFFVSKFLQNLWKVFFSKSFQSSPYPCNNLNFQAFNVIFCFLWSYKDSPANTFEFNYIQWYSHSIFLAKLFLSGFRIKT